MQPTARALEARKQIWGIAIGGFVTAFIGYVIMVNGVDGDSMWSAANEGRIYFGLAVFGLGNLFLFVGLVGLGTMLGIRAMETPPSAAAAPSLSKPAGRAAGKQVRRADPGPMPNWAVRDLDE